MYRSLTNIEKFFNESSTRPIQSLLNVIATECNKQFKFNGDFFIMNVQVIINKFNNLIDSGCAHVNIAYRGIST